MRRQLALTLAVLCLVGGCAWLTKQRGYYTTSKSTPLAVGEQSPSDRAKNDTSPLAAIPVWGGAVAVLASFLLGKVYEVQRGKALASGTTPKSSNPIVSTLSGLAGAIFEVGPNGSSVKRSWKGIVSGLLAYGLTLVPALHAWASQSTNHYAGTLVTLTALILGAEKALSNANPPA